MRKKVLIVFGTRPEAIKMVPIIHEFEKYLDIFECKVCVTGQHRELLYQVLDFFEIKPDYDLNLMQKNQTLHELTSRIILAVTQVLEDFKPNLILVHGDTTTAMASALSAYYKQIDIAHIEAGLRSFDLYSPWPEEGNRKIIAQLAKYHFTPTQFTYDNLIRENIDKKNIFIVGNTIIDVMKKTFGNKYLSNIRDFTHSMSSVNKKMIFVSIHRREKPKDIIWNIVNTIANTANTEIYLLLSEDIKNKLGIEILKKINNIHITESLSYDKILKLLEQSYLIVTDSGTIQEEASYLGIPVLLLRDTTDRQEVEGMNIRIIGMNSTVLEKEMTILLTDDIQYRMLRKKSRIYGDGRTSKKILNFLYKIMEV